MNGPDGLRLLAVDDEEPALADLVRMLEASPAVAEVRAAGSADEALAAIAERPLDALFLDVRMPGLDGLELARVLRRFDRPPAVVFVSAYDDFAVRAFELEALDYLVKPVSRRRLDEAIDRVGRAGPGGGEDEMLAVDAPRGGTRLVARSSILFLQAHGDYVRVVCRRRALPPAGGARRPRGALGPPRLPARPPLVRRQPAPRGRGATAPQRHRACC